ncbi:hypothetical protein Tco_0269463 [Tanacetum coccineum]
MSTPAHSNSETISQTDGARSSRVPILLPNDPYMAVRQAYLATIMDSKSELFEDFRVTEIPQPLPIASSPVPSSDDPYLIPLSARTTPSSSDHIPTSPDPTPVSPLTDEEFEASEPSDTRITSSYSTTPLESTTPLTPDHPLTQTSPTPTLSQPFYYRRTTRMAVRTQPAMSPGLSARVTEEMTLSPSSFRKRSVRVTGRSQLVAIRSVPFSDLFSMLEDTETKIEESEAEGTDSEGEESEDEGHDSEGYGAARRRALELAEEISPSTFEVGQSSRSVPDQQVADGTPTPRIPARTTWIDPEDASLVTTPSATIVVDEDELLEVGAQLELHQGILHDHTQRLDALPPTLLESHGRDITELFDGPRANAGIQRKLQEMRDRVTTLEQERSRREQIINLCFADDLFLFARGHPSSVSVIMDALEEFKQVSGLVPSIPKSTAYFCNVPNAIKASILNSMPFAEGVLPVSRVNDWRNKFLSLAGRLQLIRSVLSSMHIYWASVFILPSRIVHDLEQLMHGFLWCQGEMKKGKAKVAWDSVCMPKHEGGLGIRRIEDFNIALMATHIWSIFTHRESLWVKWVHTYKLKGRSFWDVPCRGDASWGWRKLLQIRSTIRPFIWHKINNGKSTSVWFDRWTDVCPLKDLLSNRDIVRSGFSLENSVSNLISDGVWRWPLDWLSRFPFLAQLHVPVLLDDMDDVILWRDRDGVLRPF